MRKLLTTGALVAVAGALVASLAACGGSGTASAANATLQRQADMYEIGQIEKTWHRGLAHHNINAIMSLWAPHATFTIGPGQTLKGKKQIRHFFATQAEPLKPGNHWISETPAYKMRITVNGDRGTLYFECHFVDPKTKKLMEWVSADHDLEKINGHWLIINGVSGHPQLKP